MTGDKYFLFFTHSLLWFLSTSLIFANKSEKCDLCKDIAKHFNEGLFKTARSNFGGGNTNWEEKNLGRYLKSETRFLEILDQSCGESDKKECHYMIEENEEILENWWSNHYNKDRDKDLFVYLCDQTLKVCCPNGTYGPSCSDCPGGRMHSCSGHGDCKGAGYRDGKGECSCDTGYEGDVCDECSDKYFSMVDEDGKTACAACHKACQTSCTSSLSSDCEDCNSGWVFVDGQGCVDVNECSSGNFSCSSNKYCSNFDGGYECLDCDKSCSGCEGPGHDKCTECAPRHFARDSLCPACHPSCLTSCTDESAASCDQCAAGWEFDEDSKQCVDKNECQDGSHNCDASKQFCSNEPGSFRCIACHENCRGCLGPENKQCTDCQFGYQLDDDGSCQDVDECKREENICVGENEVCINVVGSFKCECVEGYVRRMGSTCFKKNLVNQPKKKSKGINIKPQDETIPKEDNNNNIPKKIRPSLKDFDVPGPGGFSEEDIKKLGDPLVGIAKSEGDSQNDKKEL